MGGAEMHQLTLKVGALMCLAILLAGCAEKKQGRMKTPSAPRPEADTITIENCDTIADSREREICSRRNLIIAKENAKKAAKDRYKSADRYEKKAIDQTLEAEENKSKQVKRQRQAIFRTHLSGCPADWPVWVSPTTVQRGPLERIYHRLDPVHSNMVITNKSNNVINMRWSEGGVGDVVKNLCPNGVLSLRQDLTFGSYYMNISYVAYAVGSVGQLGTSKSPTISLQACQSYYCIGEYSAVWEIRLQ